MKKGTKVNVKSINKNGVVISSSNNRVSIMMEDGTAKVFDANDVEMLKSGGQVKAKRKYAKGGNADVENNEMVLNNNKQIAHHTKELPNAIKGKKVPAWVVAKVNRSASDLSDATHYMDGQGESYANGGGIKQDKFAHNISNKSVDEMSWLMDACEKDDAALEFNDRETIAYFDTNELSPANKKKAENIFGKKMKDGGGVDNNILVGQVYLNTTTNGYIIIDKVEDYKEAYPSVYYHTYNQPQSYRNSNIDRISFFEDLVENGVFVLQSDKMKDGGVVDAEGEIIKKGYKVTNGGGLVGIVKEVQTNGLLYVQWISDNGEETRDLTADNDPKELYVLLEYAKGGGNTNEISITITAQYDDERGNKKNTTKSYDVNYIVTFPNEDFIELTGTLKPYHTGRDYDYEFEVNYFADEKEETYYDENNEKIEQEILDKFYSLGKMANGGSVDDLLEFTIPTWAMTSLINGDDSGLEDEDIEKVNDFVDRVSNRYGNANFMLGDKSEETEFYYRNDIDGNMGGDVTTLYLRPSKQYANGGGVEPYDEEKYSSEYDYLRKIITKNFGEKNRNFSSADWGGIDNWTIKGDMYEGIFIIIDDDAKVVLMERKHNEELEENEDTDILEAEVNDTKGLQNLFSKAIQIKENKMAQGGGVGEYVDLFEDYENIPENIQAILDRYSEDFGGDGSDMDYQDTANMLKEVEAEGYTFGYYLDNEPYGLRPIGVRLNQLKGYEEFGDDEYAKGGRLTSNEDIIEAFLTSNREAKVGNLSTHYNEYDNQMLLRNYGTLIASRKGNNVHITSIKYSVTTTKITNMVNRMAKDKGFNVKYVEKFEDGGNTSSYCYEIGGL